MTTSFQNVRPLRYWIQMVLPLVYDDSLSYMELLGKVIDTLNQLVKNNNKLPDYIMNLIKEYINSGEIKEVLQEVLANFILNVKFPPADITPAKGDGTVDDSASIQGCIDYASTTGGVVYFPYGVYMCKDIELKDNVSLKGFDRYTTRLVGFGGAQTAVIKGTASNITIADLSISANAGAQANQVDCINLQGSNYLFSNLLLLNAYRHLVLNTTTGHVQIDNIITNSAIDCSMDIDGSATIQASQIELGTIANTGTCSITINTSDGVWDIHAQSTLEPALILGGTGNELALRTPSLEPVVPENNQNNINIRGVSQNIKLSEDLKISATNALLNFITNITLNTLDISVTSNTINKEFSFSNEKVNSQKILITPEFKQQIGTLSITGNSVSQHWDVVNIKTNNFNVESNTLFTGELLNVNTIRPIKYREPQRLNSKFNYIPFQSENGKYNVITEGDMEFYYTNVKDYGAVGDGLTDDTEAFKNALNSLSKGGTLYIPSGFNCVIDEITINQPIKMCGAGANENCSIITLKSPTSNGFNIITQGVDISHLAFKSNSMQTDGYFINVNSPGRAQIHDCHFLNYYNAIIINNSINMGVENCFFENGTPNTVKAGGAAIVLGNLGYTSSPIISNCTFTNQNFNPDEAPTYGIILNYVDGAMLSNLTFSKNNIPIAIAPNSNQFCHGIYLSNCILDSSRYGLLITSIGSGEIETIGIENCWMAINTEMGARIINEASGTIAGVTFSNCHFFQEPYGAYLSPNVNNVQFINSFFSQCSSSALSLQNCKNINVSNCYFGALGEFTTNGNGIQILNDSDVIIVTSNIFNNNTQNTLVPSPKDTILLANNIIIPTEV